jgi:prepilin-type N-terminal cleavage/methylation domain-containing protein
MIAGARTRRGAGGFTLIEVMASLAILAIGLVWMIKATAGSVRRVEESRMASVVVELARGKMWDIEEGLLKDGFLETDQSSEGDFSDDGWPNVTWKAEVLKIELPSLDKLAAMSQPDPEALAAAGAGTGTGAGTASAAQLAAAESGGGIFGMLAMMGMGGGGMDAGDAAGGSFIASGYPMIQQVLEVSVRKVILTLEWKVLGRAESMQTIMYFTDPAAMTRVIGAIGGASAGDYGTDGQAPTPGGNPNPSPKK